MKSKVLLFLITIYLTMIVNIVIGYEHAPYNHPDRDQSFALQQDLRVFFKVHNDIKLLFEFNIQEGLTTGDTNLYSSSNQSNPQILAFRLGGLFRVHNNLKLGLSYQMFNRRNFLTGNLNTEHIPIVDVIPRVKLTSSLVAELRVRQEFNLYDGTEQNRDTLWYSIKLRPKLTYFIINNAKLIAAPFVSYEIYIPINYGEEYLEHWIYAGVVVPVYKYLSVIPYYSMVVYDDVKTSMYMQYTGGLKHIFGLGFNFNF